MGSTRKATVLGVIAASSAAVGQANTRCIGHCRLRALDLDAQLPCVLKGQSQGESRHSLLFELFEHHMRTAGILKTLLFHFLRKGEW